ncbi:MAG: glycosyltransferase family 2 protein [Bacilli bacterium]
MPKISVIIPVYNTEKYLDKCLKTIINQTFKNIEIIIVNDGSTDNSQKIIDKYKEKDSRIKAYSIKNSGAGGARNYGLDRAKGDYIGFIDSDDWINLKMYEKLYNKAIETNADIVTCYMKYCIGPIKVMRYKDYKINDNNSSTNIVRFIPSPVNRLYKKHLFEKVKFPENIVQEDIALIPYLFAKANNVAQVNKFLYNYRFNLKSTMISNILRVNHKFYDSIEAIGYLKANFNKLSDKYPEELEALIIDQIFMKLNMLPYSFNLKKKEKKFLYNTLIQYLNIIQPNWQSNKYYKTELFKVLFFKFSKFLANRLYFDKKHITYQTKEEIESIIYNFLKQKEG